MAWRIRVAISGALSPSARCTSALRAGQGRAGRHGDYDEAFLDWIFWRYLATVEPTDRLIVARNLT
ncbi:hypothetical protein [Streptomyces sp. NBC_00151]|uniref:hypothetical protein n=1 Tax=Streptomyces sp. NBC_00151 TaxID=2975669 RepID=UPI002DDA0602|nr:hypothetical protein [Streptomyces sp. NBC_00151]WRZ45555.1 hypothetical protein OG915_02610 [Streptomyces sp. NBC_00151]